MLCVTRRCRHSKGSSLLAFERERERTWFEFLHRNNHRKEKKSVWNHMLLFSVWRSSEWEIPRHSLRSCSWPNGHLCSVHYTIISPVGLVFFSSSSSISLFPFVYSYSFFYIYWCVYWNITPHSSIVFFSSSNCAISERVVVLSFAGCFPR